jgi:hypothetical protein
LRRVWKGDWKEKRSEVEKTRVKKWGEKEEKGNREGIRRDRKRIRTVREM